MQTIRTCINERSLFKEKIFNADLQCKYDCKYPVKLNNRGVFIYLYIFKRTFFFFNLQIHKDMIQETEKSH